MHRHGLLVCRRHTRLPQRIVESAQLRGRSIMISMSKALCCSQEIGCLSETSGLLGEEDSLVVERMGDGPVYRVQPETGDGTLRVLHCNLLLLVNDLPSEHDEQGQRAPGTRQTQRDNHRKSSETLEQESEHSDEEEEYTYCLRTIPVYNRRVRSPVASVQTTK